MTKPSEITDQQFEEQVLQSDKPTLVDFWAEWCGPCKMIAPIVEELASEYDGKVNFVKLDVDSNPHTALEYGIRSIPTLLIFRDGKVEQQIIGAVPKVALKKKIDAVLETT
jgi:thioredoxin 1